MPRTSLSSPVQGCMTYMAAALRSCCPPLVVRRYSPPPNSEQSLLEGRQLQQPFSTTDETSTLPPRQSVVISERTRLLTKTEQVMPSDMSGRDGAVAQSAAPRKGTATSSSSKTGKKEPPFYLDMHIFWRVFMVVIPFLESSNLFIHSFNSLAHLSETSLGEDEDVCPTCLEPYAPDNPRVVAKCGHHFHMPCIYAWMERSPTCPMCGAKMEQMKCESG